MKILVTGGLGYIGSHVATLLIEKNHNIVIADNLSNASISVLDGIEKITQQRPLFEEVDLCQKDAVTKLFHRHPHIDGVVHFAAHKAVQESFVNPLKYYQNNIIGLLNILETLVSENIPMLFSSSCTVYGEATHFPISEQSPIKPAVSPYGTTKQMGENMLTDCCHAHPNFKAILLRYFNPIGAHPTAHIGETPQGIPQNLVPFLVQTAAGKRAALQVFGTDYPTPDGSCIRDYIHVMDLAEAHIIAIEHLIQKKQVPPCEIYNVGCGKGHSVLEVVAEFEAVTGVQVPLQFVNRREGDVVKAYADTTKITNQLGWKAQYTLKEALLSAWEWEQKQMKYE
ncbi:MAG: UDP-glucose 4-epimerase GalE [Flavobacteriaceae bacterium]